MTADEVVLAAPTLRRAGAGVGESVRVGDRDVTVVGTAVFPGYSEYPGQDPTDLGSGAWFTIEGLESAGTVFTGRSLLVGVTPGVDARAAFDGYTADGFVLASEDIAFDAFRPSTVVNLERVRSTPVLIALALAGLGMVATINVLVLSVRRRRPELGVLRALGFSRRQLMATVGWQALLMALVAAVVGVPLGIVVGRVAWDALIDELGGISQPVVPMPVILAVVAATLALAYLAAVLPARSAARTHAATALRVE